MITRIGKDFAVTLDKATVRTEMPGGQVVDRAFGSDGCAEAMIYAHEQCALLGGKGESWVMVVCSACGEAEADNMWPAPAPARRCPRTGRYRKVVMTAVPEWIWASSREDAEVIGAGLKHRDACPCVRCGERQTHAGCGCAEGLALAEKALKERKRRDSALPGLARKGDWN